MIENDHVAHVEDHRLNVEVGVRDVESACECVLLRPEGRVDIPDDGVVGHLRAGARAAGAEATRGPRKSRVVAMCVRDRTNLRSVRVYTRLSTYGT